MPKFTVVTICYNDMVGLASTINSVGHQTFSDFQYVVQDGNSTDHSKEIVQGFGDWIDVFNSVPDDGIYDAMNRAVQSATGDYLLFLNSADVFADEYVLENLNKMMLDDDEIVHGKSMDLHTGKIHKFRALNDYALGNIFDHQAAIIKTDLLRKWPYDCSYNVCSDLDFFSRCHAEGVRFRQVDLTIPKKPYVVGVSSDYLARFRERWLILPKRFGEKFPQVESKLRSELLNYIDKTYGSKDLNKNIQQLDVPEILEKVDALAEQLVDAVGC